LRKAALKTVRLWKRMRFDIGDVVREPADYVFLVNVCHGVPDKSRLARAVHDVLRPGGSFAIVNWHAKPREQTTILEEPRGPATELRMTPEQTIASVEPSGLTFGADRGFAYHFAAVFERAR
jgi:SAM-dependent methyltransferase